MKSNILTASLAPLAVLYGLAMPASAQVIPKTQLNIGGSNGSGTEGIGVAVRGTTFYAAWTEREGTGGSSKDIWFSSSTDDGQTWRPPVRVDTGEVAHLNDSDQPRIAVTDNGSVIVVFEECRDAVAGGGSTESDAFYNRSTDGGVTWLPAALPLNITTAGSNILTDIDRISIHSSGNNVYVSWEEDETSGLGGPEDVKFTMSTNAGASWSTPTIVTATMPQVNDATDPKIAGSGNNVVVAYIVDNAGDDDLEILNSTNGGVTWTQTAVESVTTGMAETARIAMDGDNVLVAWFDDEISGSNNNEIHVVFSTNGGITWSTEMSVTPTVGANAPARAYDLDLVVSGNYFYVAYTDDSAAVISGNASTIDSGKLYMSRSTNAGATWALEIAVDGDPLRVNQRPHMAAVGSRVVVHTEVGISGGNGLGYVVSANSGTTWGPVQLVPGAGPDVDSEDDNNGKAMAMSPVSGTAVSAFWDSASPTGNNEVFISGIAGMSLLGTNYCMANVNSTGLRASMGATGSDVLSDNDVTLRASGMPQNSFSFFLTSLTQGFSPNPGGSAGNLCVLGDIGRYVGGGQIQQTGAGGTISLTIDLTQIPQPLGFVAAVAGETWNYQAWFRDVIGGVAGSNFTNGQAVTFQ